MTKKIQKIDKILTRLTGGVHGKIFLVNLNEGIKAGYIDGKVVGDTLCAINLKSIRYLDDDSLLGHLKSLLASSTKLFLQNSRNAIYPQFSDGQPLLTTFSVKDYEAYYEHPAIRIMGHAFSERIPGEYATRYRPSAKTNTTFWVAASQSIPGQPTMVLSADNTRDILGLVHIGRNTQLVCMYFKPPTNECYYPTIIEASPNQRFHQCGGYYCREDRWGVTVHLALLEKRKFPDSINGKPELILKQLSIRDCTDVTFYYIGETTQDRDTSATDVKFSEHLLGRRTISKIISDLKKVVA